MARNYEANTREVRKTHLVIGVLAGAIVLMLIGAVALVLSVGSAVRQRTALRDIQARLDLLEGVVTSLAAQADGGDVATPQVAAPESVQDKSASFATATHPPPGSGSAEAGAQGARKDEFDNLHRKPVGSKSTTAKEIEQLPVPPRGTESEKMAAAVQYLNQEDYEQALAAIYEIEPNDAHAGEFSLIRAKALLGLDRLQDAYEAVREAASRVPSIPEAMLLRGRIELQLDLGVQAETTLTRAMRLPDVADEAAGLLCAHLVAEGDAARASEILRQVEREYQDVPALIRCRMNLAFTNGAWDECIELADQLMQEAGWDTSLIAMKAKALNAAGRWNDAVNAAGAWVMQEPQNPQGYGQLGLALLAGMDAAGAAEAFRKQVQLAPGDSMGWFLLGVALANGDRLDEAENALTRAIDLDGAGSDALLARCVVRARTGDAPGANQDCEAAASLDPDAAGRVREHSAVAAVLQDH